MLRVKFWWVGAFVLLACSNDDGGQAGCLPDLSVCNSNGRFCTFGSKWGEDRLFSPAGNNTPGPGTSGGTVTFSFQGPGESFVLNDETLESRDFEVHQIACAKDMIRQAFDAYSAVANIDFQEEAASPNSDIRLFAAIIDPTAVGFPPMTGSCQFVSGQIIFDGRSRSCHEFFLLALHEIGHALGLGHPGRGNVMSQGLPDPSYTGLRAGDIEGIRSIYGARN